MATVLADPSPMPRPPRRQRPTYEYPIGIGIWHTYCQESEDCPLYDAAAPWNETQTCQVSLNPGKGFHHYDTIVGAWVALFINMANLYWWETAHRIYDSEVSHVTRPLAPPYSLHTVLLKVEVHQPCNFYA